MNTPTELERAAVEYLRAMDLDYQKYGDRRGDRSAYDAIMMYEVTAIAEQVFMDAHKIGHDAGIRAAAEYMGPGYGRLILQQLLETGGRGKV